MGCDIHLHTEIKLNGKWEHYTAPRIGRNYDLFARMAGVRNYDKVSPIVEPKGAPDDMSVVTAFDYQEWEPDAHSASWFNADEITALYKSPEVRDYEAIRRDRGDFHSFADYLFGNDWKFYSAYRDHYPQQIEDIRWVFWFDN